jgi:hypothetical protein
MIFVFILVIQCVCFVSLSYSIHSYRMDRLIFPKNSATSCALLFGGKGRHLLLPWLRSALDDKITFACVALLLLGVAVFACWVPAR